MDKEPLTHAAAAILDSFSLFCPRGLNSALGIPCAITRVQRAKLPDDYRVVIPRPAPFSDRQQIQARRQTREVQFDIQNRDVITQIRRT